MPSYEYETPQEIMDFCKERYHFDEYLLMTPEEREDWRFEQLVNMTYDEIVAFYEYCIEPEELRTGLQVNIEKDIEEARNRLKQAQEYNEQHRKIITQLHAENSNKEKKLQELVKEQQARDTEWEDEEEDGELPQ